jgi:acetate---CoA ligase (ADP-forming)
VSGGFDPERAQRAVEALLAPRNIALVGANDRPGSWSARTWQNLEQYEFPGTVYPVNPRRTEIWAGPCYPNLAALPEAPDHIALLVPPAAVIGVLHEAARAGARSATIFTSGIGDATGVDGMRLGGEVARVIRETGLAVSGPNCMGNFCARTRMATLNDPHPLPTVRGPLAMVGQSGGVMLFTAHALHDRCIDVGYIVTSGNELGLTTADYIVAFAADPDIEVIVSYVEGIRNADAFRQACATAQAAGKHIVLLKMGRSVAGRQAALSHTGTLAGRLDVFDAIAGELGVIRVDTADDVVETVELLLHAPRLRGRRLAGLTLSGAFRGMLLDAAAENGLTFPPLAPETTERLGALLGAGAMVGNPVDGGFGVVTSAQTYRDCIEALDADPNVDLLVIQEELAREPVPERAGRWMAIAEEFAATRATKPIAYASFVSYGLSAHSRRLRSRLPHIAILQESSRAVRAIAKTVRCSEMEALAAGSVAAPGPRADGRFAAGRTTSGPLDEVRSKEIVRAFGIPTLDETVVPNDVRAVQAAAAKVAGSVVLKAVGRRLLHKSDAGAVALDLRGAGDVAAAFERIVRGVDAHDVGPIEAFLVAPYITDGIHVILGVHRDPEMGLVVMVGSGGVLVELIDDVVFVAPPISREKAIDAIGRTRIGRLVHGYRGARAVDGEALIDAVVGLGRLATELGDVLESVDINPFVVRPSGVTSVALDALVILR